MILGTGIDIVELDRISGALERHGGKFVERICTTEERQELEVDSELFLRRLAGKFAAKEAFMKALGTGMAQKVTWQNVMITSGPNGAPIVRLKGKAGEISDNKGVKAIHVSISHSANIAVAMVVLEN